MKHSLKREKIITIFQDGSLLTANEVSSKVNDIDRATVYRNLNLLLEEGILRKVNLRVGIASYELANNGDNHQHFICNNCEKIIPIEIDIAIIEKLKPAGSELKAYELNLKGKCQECI